MNERKNILFTSCLCFFLFFILFPVFTQEDTENGPTPAEIAAIKFKKTIELYKAGEYEKCREKVDEYIYEFEEQDIYYQASITSYFYVLKAMVSYAFREDGYKEEIENLFNNAIQINLNLEIGDVATVPPFLLELFNKTKKEYLSQYSKTAKRNTFGFVMTLVCTDPFDGSNLQPGIYYAFNITDSVSINADVKVPIQGQFWNFWRIKLGGLWYRDFRVEKLVYALGLNGILKINNWTLQTISFSFCGHGEYISRNGFGLAADVELLHVDLNFIQDESEEITNLSEIGQGSVFELFFTNLDFYIVFTF